MRSKKQNKNFIRNNLVYIIVIFIIIILGSISLIISKKSNKTEISKVSSDSSIPNVESANTVIQLTTADDLQNAEIVVTDKENDYDLYYYIIPIETGDSIVNVVNLVKQTVESYRLNQYKLYDEDLELDDNCIVCFAYAKKRSFQF